MSMILRLIFLFIAFPVLCGATTEFIPLSPVHAQEGDQKRLVIPCGVEHRYGEYRNLVSNLDLFIHEVDSGYRFHQCRRQIENARLKLCSDKTRLEYIQNTYDILIDCGARSELDLD